MLVISARRISSLRQFNHNKKQRLISKKYYASPNEASIVDDEYDQESYFADVPEVLEELVSLRDDPVDLEAYLTQFVPNLGDDANKIAAQIYIIAEDSGCMDEVEKDLITIYNSKDLAPYYFAFNESLYDTEETGDYFRDPKNLVDLGIHPITGQILGYLAESGHKLEIILWAITDFLELLKIARKEVVLKLTLPAGTDENYQKFLLNHIKNEYKLHDSKLEISITEDKNIYGGYRLALDQNIIDKTYNTAHKASNDTIKVPQSHPYSYVEKETDTLQEAEKIFKTLQLD